MVYSVYNVFMTYTQTVGKHGSYFIYDYDNKMK